MCLVQGLGELGVWKCQGDNHMLYHPLTAFSYQTQANLTIMSAVNSCCLGVGNHRKHFSQTSLSHILGDPLVSAGGCLEQVILP